MVDTEIIALHGWAFDRHIWDNFEQRLPDTLHWVPWDRGYFHEPIDAEFSAAATRKVIITHSFGLHQLKTEWISQTDILVIISGFRDFHPGTPQYRKRSKAIIASMQRELKNDPVAVLNKFYEQCYSPDDAPITFSTQNRWDNELLIKDLDDLNTAQLGKAILSIPEVCILHGTADHVVPHTKGRELFNYLGDNTSYYEIRNAGHSLPETHATICSNFIEPILFNR